MATVAIFLSKTSPTPPSTPTPTPKIEANSNTIRLCAKFTSFATINYKISCENAVEKALMQIQGTAAKVSIESMRVTIPTATSFERKTIKIWAVNIKLAKPIFDEEFKKTVYVWRIGIPTDGYEGIYKMPIE